MHNSGLELALVFLLAAVIAVPVFKRFGLSAVLGYLAAGVALGPFGLAVIRDTERVLAASEIGVVMLLFVIGLELSLPRLKLMRRPVFGIGGLQVLSSGLALGALAMLLGNGWKSALVIGLGLALSSTAVGLQLLAERKELNTEHGRLAFAILLFQDLAAIPLLAVIPLLGNAAASAAETSFWPTTLKAIAAIAALVLGGRILLRHVFQIVARTGMPEVFTAVALLVVLGSAWLMEEAGLSAALGAFLAGVLLADSAFRHELEAQIKPFEGLLLGMFFMAVGMGIDLRAVLAAPVVIGAMALGLMAIKFLLLFAIGLRPGRLDRRSARLLASVLALGGEFAFVVFREGRKAALIDDALLNQLMAVVGISMALTPLLLIVMSRIGGKPKSGLSKQPYDDIPDNHPQVLIAGFGRVGQIVARLLLTQRIPFVAIDNDAAGVEFFRRFGNPVYYGDPAKLDLLRAAGAQRIRIFVIAVNDLDASLRIVRLIRRNYPQAKIFARARDRRHVWPLMDLGVTAFRETYGTSLEIGREVMTALGIERALAEQRVRTFREADERILAAQHLVYDDEEALIRTAQDGRRELEQLFAADLGEGILGQASGNDVPAARTPTPASARSSGPA